MCKIDQIQSLKREIATLEYTLNYIDRSTNTRIEAIKIAKGRDFLCYREMASIYSSDHAFGPSLKKEDCVLVGVAYPLGWEVWVKKDEPK